MNPICPLHNIPFIKHDKNGQTWYSHPIGQTKEWCNESKLPKTSPPETPKAEVREKIVETPPYVDLRSRRIERQHSQDMAISFLELLVKVTPEAFMDMKKPLREMVKEYTDYFQSDLDSPVQATEG